jgi:hypothetical protein
MLNKRSFLTGTIAAAAATAAAQAQTPAPRNGLNPPRKIAHGMMKTTRLFKSPPGYANGLAVAPEGLSMAQSAMAYPNPPTSAKPPGWWTGTASCSRR